ncbi:MAG: SPBc2 prophage-derived uncharacterized N-acetyltransferase YokL [uncultured Thermomicrobiales bacterium]|uniref:SPBc2 prophage-derived uncharacterized N-acetyltransferase YokL n=1 Tax=uncultured Thermomicrobiales bacterium TaxID=1645740 RepID=A0A6J4V3X4_9BACT|nr:MAG: SPBc2 prophage-derived uncharacterized N-acetyltransferase YokL [uncultured Thermomicrobiales bacterium]
MTGERGLDGPGTSIWQGFTVRLRAVEPEDWEYFHRWGGDDVVARATDAVPFPESRAATRSWTEHEANRERSNDRFRWVMVDADDSPVGTINTHSCDRLAGTLSFGLAVAPERQGEGFASEAIRLVLRYFFDELGYQKVNAHVYAFNGASQALHENLGFVQEGRLRRMHYAAGRHWDTLVYGMTREEFAAEQAGKLPPMGAPDQP